MNDRVTGFKGNRCYTRRQIAKYLGGSTQNYLPHKNGMVVCGCFRSDLNPAAPSEVLPGNTDDIRRWAEVFSLQRETVPIFLKKESNRWQFAGYWRCASKIEDRDKIRAREKQIGRTDISMILKLKRSTP